MSDKEITTPNPIAPMLEVPAEAPKPAFDLDNPDLSIMDVFPENFFSMEGLQAILDTEAAHSLLLTVTACTMEYIYDPAKGEAYGEWKPVLTFDEVGSKLVLNKTRAKSAADMCGSALVRDWARLGKVYIRPGIKDGNAQILLEPVKRARVNGNGKSQKASPDELAEELFAN